MILKSMHISCINKFMNLVHRASEHNYNIVYCDDKKCR